MRQPSSGAQWEEQTFTLPINTIIPSDDVWGTSNGSATGVKKGQYIAWSSDQSLGGLIVRAYSPADDVVALTVFNATAAPITILSDTVFILMIEPVG
jgi:hypothetical protein